MKMKRKIISLLLVILSVISLLPLMAMAEIETTCEEPEPPPISLNTITASSAPTAQNLNDTLNGILDCVSIVICVEWKNNGKSGNLYTVH